MMLAADRRTGRLASLQQDWTEDCASQIVELAISLPVLVIFVVGIFDFGGALTLKQKLTNAAREGAEEHEATFVDHHGSQPIAGEAGVRVWFAERSQRWNRLGFLLMTAGFLCDFAGKW